MKVLDKGEDFFVYQFCFLVNVACARPEWPVQILLPLKSGSFKFSILLRGAAAPSLRTGLLEVLVRVK